MKNLLSYDSKFITALGVVADMFLNVLFLIFCIPLVTIGPATTALYSGCRALVEQKPCFRAFFRSFKNSLRRGIPAWLIQLLPVLLFSWCAWVLWQNKFTAYLPAFLVSVAVLLFLFAMINITCLFYSYFECTLPQLLKNGLLVTLGCIVRATLMGLFMWLPVIFFFLLPDTFMRLGILWLLFYSAAIANLCVRLMRRPFAMLAEQSGFTLPEPPAPVPEETEE